MKKLPLFLIGITASACIAGTAVALSTQNNKSAQQTPDKEIERPDTEQSNISNSVFANISDQTYTGEAIIPGLLGFAGQNQLVLGTDYTATFSKNTNVGTADVLITGKGTYTGEKTLHFNIVKAQNSWLEEPDIETMSVGTPKFGEVRLFIKAAGSDDEDYIELFFDEEEGYLPSQEDEADLEAFYYGGQAVVVKILVEGTDNYTGLIETVNFTLPLSANVLNIESQEYTGNAITPTVQVVDGDTNQSLVLGTDFTVAFSDNTDVGVATAVVSFIGDYAGVEPITTHFNILQAQNSWTVQPTYSISGYAVNFTQGTPVFGSAVYEYKGEFEPEWTEIQSPSIILDNGNYNLRVTVPGTNNYSDLILEDTFTVDVQNAGQTLAYSFDNNGNITGYSGNETNLVLPASYSLGQVTTQNYNTQIDLSQQASDIEQQFQGMPQEQIDSMVEQQLGNTLEQEIMNYLQNLNLSDVPGGDLMMFSNRIRQNNGAIETEGEYSFVLLNNNYVYTLAITKTMQEYVVGADFTVTGIGQQVFENNQTIETVVIPGTVTSIGEYAFAGCSNLVNITIPVGVTSIGEHAFYYCSSLRNITLPNGLTSIGSNAFSNSGIETISIPSTAIFMPGVFSNCSSLRSVDLPSEIIIIQQEAFMGCSALESIDLSNVRTILQNAFYGCSSLTSVDISKATSIWSSAFQNCSNLETVILSDNLTKLNSSIFEGCSSLINIDLKNITEIKNYAFRNCTALTSVVLDKVTNIGNSAFSGCSNLTSVTLKSSRKATLGTSIVPAGTTIYVPSELLSAYQTSYASYTFAAIPAEEPQA